MLLQSFSKLWTVISLNRDGVRCSIVSKTSQPASRLIIYYTLTTRSFLALTPTKQTYENVRARFAAVRLLGRFSVRCVVAEAVRLPGSATE